jgi:hypothetical protein
MLYIPSYLVNLHNSTAVSSKKTFFKGCPGRAGEQTRDQLILFIFSFHHFTAVPQRLPNP